MNDLIFLKLGGSLITNKDQRSTALPARIDMLVDQIHEFLVQSPTSRIVLGHGSGSFGHFAANKYNTRQGVQTEAEWQGFIEVWHEARALNQILVEKLFQHYLKVICFPLSAMAVTHGGLLEFFPVSPIEEALHQGLVPVVYGDVVLDKKLGGTILSTEEQFQFLAKILHPSRILLAGIEQGIWEDFPTCTKLIRSMSLNEYSSNKNEIGASASVDVTGGMASKVKEMFSIVQNDPEIKIQIFSAVEPGTLLRALKGEPIGTVLTA